GGRLSMIETCKLGREFGGRYVLSDIDLSLEKGEVFALIGPSGAGKTTLLRLLDLLDLPSRGQVLFDGTDVTASRPERLKARRRMAFVQQKPVVFTMSVFENVACGLKWRREKPELIRRRVEDALELVGMMEYKDRSAKTLSGGETQRVAIARALTTCPEVLLLDEPTANLDPVSVSKIEEVLAHIIGEHEMTVVMATHDMSQGQRLADRVGVLGKGRMLQLGSPREIFTLPGSREVAELVGVENILAGVVTGRENGLVTVDINGRAIQAVSDYGVGEKVDVLIRPEDITLTLSPDKSSARNTFTGKIVRAVLVGALIRIEVDCGFLLLGLVTKRSAEELNLTPGKSVSASFKASAVRTLKRWL
ncbi:ABC transporter ATP-binding protein, partial [Chloroflexota bacterium]